MPPHAGDALNKTLVLILGGLVAISALAGDVDKRQVLTITDPRHGHVLEEMRAFLAGIQQIRAALSNSV